MAFNWFRASARLADLAQAHHVDVVLTNTITMPAGSFAARRSRVPHAWYLHEYGRLDHQQIFHWGEWSSVRAISVLSARVLVNSETLKLHYAQSIPGSKIVVVPYSVEVPSMATAAPAANGRFRLILLGEKKAGKGQHDAVRALACLNARGLRCELALVGGADPAYEASLRREATTLGLESQIDFIDFDPDRFDRLSRADVALMCSRFEAFGRVTVEAMKLGRPVVGARAGATPELVRDGENGLLYRVDDPEDLAAKVEILYRDPDLRRSMGARGRAWANMNFTRERYGLALENALGNTIDGKSNR
jgi:glycosyltransferase involved in cell wall biosynthesis